ncbi:hypothetical protein B0J17DRAFT_661810 [Rhizoctonia solani]|nr:hypothetical protein B0J17DRAFT_661810 [Rhizoctonia solani]
MPSEPLLPVFTPIPPPSYQPCNSYEVYQTDLKLIAEFDPSYSQASPPHGISSQSWRDALHSLRGDPRFSPKEPTAWQRALLILLVVILFWSVFNWR